MKTARCQEGVEKVSEKADCTGVILAGGCNRRLGGIHKSLRRVGAKTLLDRMYTLFSGMFREVILVVNDPVLFLDVDALIVTDIDPSRCALAGLHAGLFHAGSDWCCVAACDLPFLSETVIRYLLEQRGPGKQVVMPRTRQGPEPLCALYHTSCLPGIETSLNKKRFTIQTCFRPERVRQISPHILETLDPALHFAFNVNTPADLETARRMARNPLSEAP